MPARCSRPMPSAVERGECLRLVAVVVDVDAAIGQHARRRRRSAGRTRARAASASCRPSDDPRPEQVVQMQRADQPLRIVDDQQLGNLWAPVSIVSTQSTARRSARDRARRRASSRRRHLTARTSRTRVEAAAQIAVGEDSRDAPVGVDDGGHAHALAAHFDDRLRRASRSMRHTGSRVAGAHDVGDTRQQPPAAALRRDASARNPRPRIRARRAAPAPARHPSASAAVVLAVGARPERTRFGVDGGVEMHVGAPARASSARCRSSAMSRAPSRFRCGVSATSSSVSPEFDSMTTISSARDHAEVAVRRLGGMHEERGRAGGARAWQRACAPM